MTFVVFDLGEVLSVAPPHLPELAALAVAADPDAFASVYSPPTSRAR